MVQSPGPVALSPLELAVGEPLGVDRSHRSAVRDSHASLADALRAALLPALTRPPALVAFSGGRDSSMLLALAVDAARRHGLDAPIAVTYRNRDAPATAEDDWQETVVAHLGIDEWVRIQGSDELDYIGPIAAEGLERHGVQYPPNGHFVRLVAREASGGSVVLGIGGDELLADWRWNHRADVLARRVAPTPRSAGTLLLGSAPAPLRRRYLSRRLPRSDPSWLTPRARQMLAGIARGQAAQPPHFDDYVRWTPSQPTVAVSAVTLGRHAADFGVTLTLPLLDDRFVATLAALGGRDGWGSRTAAMHQIGSELLPPAVLGRSTKARFHEVYMGARSRRFAAEPDSAPGDPRLADLVDATRLRAEWASPVVDIRSALALQASWIAVRSDTNVRNV